MPSTLVPRSLCRYCQRSASTVASKSSHILWHYLEKPVPYLEGLRLQETLVSRRAQSRNMMLEQRQNGHHLSHAQLEKHASIASQDILLLLQHTPVYTTGRRETDESILKVEKQRLTGIGADYIAAQRGGQTTYHGPGQLVGYPILDTGAMDVSTP